MNPNQSLQAVLGIHQSLAVIGAAWGDEGKGKIVDFLCLIFDIIVRFSGGRNAGHTIWLPDGRKVVCHLLPSGVATGKTCVLARGVLFDPVGFVEEYDEIVKTIGRMPDVWVDEQCTVWTPWHTLLEMWIESIRSQSLTGINTTKRGIGPLAAISALRCDIKVNDVVGDTKRLLAKLVVLYDVLRPILNQLPPEHKVPTPREVLDLLDVVSHRIAPHVQDTSYFLWKQLRDQRRVLFEGAQATMLDLQFGTNPFVSSGMSTAAGAAYGTGLPPSAIDAVILVAKPYPTRVGSGPMVSEIWERGAAEQFPKHHPELFESGAVRDAFLVQKLDRINSGQATPGEESQYFQVLMVELGATTGRGRSVGYPDLPIMRYAQRVNGAQYLALTKFDMIAGLRQIPVVMNYRRRNGELVGWGEMPLTEDLATTQRVIERRCGWFNDIRGGQDYVGLPKEAQALVELFEEESHTRALLIGTGPNRDSMIVRA